MRKTADLVEEITMASQEQNKGAEQINQAVVQLDTVVQQNASASEELASMSEELLSQATSMKDAIGFFRVKKSEQKKTKYLADYSSGTYAPIGGGENLSEIPSEVLTSYEHTGYEDRFDES